MGKDGLTGITKLIVAFRNFANRPKSIVLKICVEQSSLTAELPSKLQHFMEPKVYYLSHKTVPLDHIPKQSKPRILALCVHSFPTHSVIIRPSISDWSFQIISHLHEFCRMCFVLFSSPTFLCNFSSTFAQLAQCRNTSYA